MDDGEGAARVVAISVAAAQAGSIEQHERTSTPSRQADPWRVPVVVAQIPEGGLHRDIEADAAAREAMAEVAGLREILSAQCIARS